MVREGFKVELVDPTKASFTDGLNLAELFLRTFEEDELIQYGAGKYAYAHRGSLANLRQSIKDPAVRLREYVEAAKKNKLHHYARGRAFYSALMSPKTMCFNLYKGDELVGNSTWFLNVVAHPEANTWYQWLRRNIVAWRLWFATVWDFGFFRGNRAVGGPGHRLIGSSAKKAGDEHRAKLPQDEAELLKLVQNDELVLYPSDFHPATVLLGYFYISPEYQRQGLGRLFINETTDRVREAIVAAKADTLLPPRAYLWASDEGIPLYKSVGFRIAHNIRVEDKEKGVVIEFPRLEKAL